MDGGDQPPLAGAAPATDPPEKEAAVPAPPGSAGSVSCEAMAGAISATLGSVMQEMDSRAEGAARSQDELGLSIDRLTGELDKLLEDAPLPIIMQHAAKISSIHKRVSGLNLLLKSVQRRVDNIDRMLSTSIPIDKVPPDVLETSSLTL